MSPDVKHLSLRETKVAKNLRLMILAGIAVVLVAAWADPAVRSIFLPGTQPNVVQPSDDPGHCQICHLSQSDANNVTITSDWQGSMMAHAARDPIFYAALAVANKYVSGAGEYCLRCHSPTGWLEGRSTPPTGMGLAGNDLEGVHCDACHRMKDPMIPDSTADPAVPGYGNGMYVVQVPKLPKRGPFADALAVHRIVADSFQQSADLCGVCHNVSNPLYAANPITQSPHEYSPIERTYSEWLLSWYAQQGETGNCQSCHMRAEPGYGSNIPGTPLRPNVPKHDLTGGNTFVPDILADFWGKGIDASRLAEGKQRATSMLQSAAALEASLHRLPDTVTVLVRITNLTGHKLPTGYPEGRRMWLNVVGRDAYGDTVFQSGAYDFETAELTMDSQAKVYEILPGLSPARAVQYGLPQGPSFHFILNDTIYSDNRIPPRGFRNAAFAEHLAQPVGYAYADGQYWDSIKYYLPLSAAAVTVTLYYQTASKEYITFLRDENIGNPNDWRAWGDSLFSAWARRGKSRPIAMASTTLIVTSAERMENIAGAFSLEQNYPNPFNPRTTIPFMLPYSGNVRLVVFTPLGQQVAVLVNGMKEAGYHEVEFDAGGLASGVYLYRIQVGSPDDGQAGAIIATRKLLVLR